MSQHWHQHPELGAQQLQHCSYFCVLASKAVGHTALNLLNCALDHQPLLSAYLALPLCVGSLNYNTCLLHVEASLSEIRPIWFCNWYLMPRPG